MTSLAPPTLVWFYKEWEKLPDYPSATFSGIVPDQAHLERGGYHVSIEDLIRFGNANDYSNKMALDKAPPVTTPDGIKQSAAVDVSLSKTDMVKLYHRVTKVFNDRTDPRRKWLNYWNVWDGTEGKLPTRYNFQLNTTSTTDRSHEWHSHNDHPRAYVDLALSVDNCWIAVRAALSVVKGETAAQWLEGEDMPLTAADIAAVATAVWGKNIVIPYDADPNTPTVKSYSAYGSQVDTVIAVRDMNEKDIPRIEAMLVSLQESVNKIPTTIDVVALAAAIVAALPPIEAGITKADVTEACLLALTKLNLSVEL